MKKIRTFWQSLSKKQKSITVAVIAIIALALIFPWKEEPKHPGNWHHPNPSERPVAVELKDSNAGTANVFYDIAAEEGGMGYGVQSENGGLEYPEIANTTVELATTDVQQLVEHVIEDEQSKPDVTINEVIYTSENGDANIVDIDESAMEDLISSNDTADKEVTVIKEERKADPQPTNPEPKKTEEQKPSVEIKEVKKEEPAKKEEVKEEKQEEKEEYVVEVSEDTTTVDLTEVEMDLTPVQTINPETSSPEVTTFVASENTNENLQAEAEATLEDLGW